MARNSEAATRARRSKALATYLGGGSIAFDTNDTTPLARTEVSIDTDMGPLGPGRDSAPFGRLAEATEDLLSRPVVRFRKNAKGEDLFTIPDSVRWHRDDPVTVREFVEAAVVLGAGYATGELGRIKKRPSSSTSGTDPDPKPDAPSTGAGARRAGGGRGGGSRGTAAAPGAAPGADTNPDKSKA